MLEFILIGLGAIGFTFWYSYEKYMSRRRYIIAPPIIDRIPQHTPQENGYIPSVMDYRSVHTAENDEVPPKYEEINLHN
jgi:hypothetical protein